MFKFIQWLGACTGCVSGSITVISYFNGFNYEALAWCVGSFAVASLAGFLNGEHLKGNENV